MSKPEDQLQEKLERLEAGADLDACLAGLDKTQAELLKLAAGLRVVEYPARDERIVAAQRASLTRRSSQEAKMSSQQKARRSLLGLRPLTAFSAAAALLVIFMCSALLIGGGLWLSSQDEQHASAPQAQPQPQTSDHLVYLPYMSIPPLRDPQSAALTDVNGLVEIQSDGQSWSALDSGRTLQAGQRVRTGALSSAKLLFYDGSQVQLGPESEISLEQINAPKANAPRIIILGQRRGDAEHHVIPSTHPDSHYSVQTPSGVAEAQGTVFQVIVAPEHFARFNVDQGAVAVSNLGAAVVVVAGQSSTVLLGQTPADPLFRISGEGRVAQIGAQWVIGGQTFATDENTIIVGNPQVGDWVFVQGRITPQDVRIADLIMLLRRSPQDRFSLNGQVESIAANAWVVAGQSISVTAETDIEPGIAVGDLVHVAGLILPDGILTAESISARQPAPGLPFEFTGIVQEIGENWTISGIGIATNQETEIDLGLVVGDLARVEGWILDDGVWLAREIKRAPDETRKFELAGEVQSIAPWQVAGVSFETREWSEIQAGIEPGDRVRVEGQILADGAWVAAEITLLVKDEGSDIVFVGRVDSIDPWLVNGILLLVDDESEIIGDIGVGDWVRVYVKLSPDGLRRVHRISRLGFGSSWGCFVLSAVITSFDADSIHLHNWPDAINLNGLEIEGQLQTNAVVLLVICFDSDGQAFIVSIVVIYYGGDVIIPWPAPPDDGYGDWVIICHSPNSKNPHTLTVSRAALPAHLAHGDTLGPCPGGGHHGGGRDDDDDDD